MSGIHTEPHTQMDTYRHTVSTLSPVWYHTGWLLIGGGAMNAQSTSGAEIQPLNSFYKPLLSLSGFQNSLRGSWGPCTRFRSHTEGFLGDIWVIKKFVCWRTWQCLTDKAGIWVMTQQNGLPGSNFKSQQYLKQHTPTNTARCIVLTQGWFLI